jgi:hypothetical protein
MNQAAGSHFDNIESAHDFVDLLSDTVTEAKQLIDADIEREVSSNTSRRLDALRVISYNLEKLAVHMKKSCRVLNDLRTLRRLLFEERTAAAASKPLVIAKADLPLPVVHSTRPATVVRPAPGPGSA